ncbi:MAG: C39 family peptidase [Pirellulales bacterium]
MKVLVAPACCLVTLGLAVGCAPSSERSEAKAAAKQPSASPVRTPMAGPRPSARSTNAAIAPARLTPPTYASVLIRDVPHVRQRPDFCGEACAEMFLRKLGSKINQDDVFNRSGLDPALGRGCYTRELAAALAKVGFRVGKVFEQVSAAKAPAQMEAQWKALHADLARGVPSIVCTHFDDQPQTTEHFRLVLGYDAKTDEVLYHEPAEDRGAYRRMKREQLLKLWPLKYTSDAWTVVRLRLEPEKVREQDSPTRPTGGFSNADYAQHVMKLQKRIAGLGFSLVIEPPFVVIGDEPRDEVRRHAVGTVRWAVEKLKADYFAKDPAEILDIWLFQDDASYMKHAVELFGAKPSTPYGYFSQADRALVMNIQTGGGTLVHELVHPFMAANFPGCPSWFNEGLGSLYEQSREVDGHIHGDTNWRLAGLQQEIKAKRLLSFEKLTATTTREFYEQDKGANYSQARYLCYWLQQKGLLVKFYQQFRADALDDPTGYRTLQAVLGKPDMVAFQKNWEAYVLKLRFP